MDEVPEVVLVYGSVRAYLLSEMASTTGLTVGAVGYVSALVNSIVPNPSIPAILCAAVGIAGYAAATITDTWQNRLVLRAFDAQVNHLEDMIR